MNMKKILEMKAKREDARLKAMAVLNKAEAEDRFLSEDEQKDIDKYEEEIRAWDESIGRAEKLLAIEPEDRSTEKPEVKPTPARTTKRDSRLSANSSWRHTERQRRAARWTKDSPRERQAVLTKALPRTAVSLFSRTL